MSSNTGNPMVMVRLEPDILAQLQVKAPRQPGRSSGVAHLLRSLAYRHLELADPEPYAKKGNPRKSKPSRPARLSQILKDLHSLVEEYEEWQSNLPEALQGTGLADKLEEAIGQLTDAATILESVDLPKGFGRD